MNDKLKKGLVTVTLSAFLIFATSIYDVQAVELEPIQFTDIAGHWAYQDIAFIQQEGLLFPINNGAFLPRKEISRA